MGDAEDTSALLIETLALDYIELALSESPKFFRHL